MRLVLALCAALLLAGAQEAPEDLPVWIQQGPMAEHRISGEGYVLPAGTVSMSLDEFAFEIVVSEAGAVVEVRPLPDRYRSSGPDYSRLEARAQAMVRGWRFKPFIRDGRTVRARGVVWIVLPGEERKPTRHVAFPDIKLEDVTITLDRSACNGVCPRYTLTIRGDGSVEFDGKGGMLVPGKRRYAVPVERVEHLLARFRDGDFWSLDSAYIMAINHSPTYTLTVSGGGYSKSVKDYVGGGVGMPAIVTELEDLVDETADAGRWIHGNARTFEALDAEKFDFRAPGVAEMLRHAIDRSPDEIVLGLLDRGAPLDVASNCPSCPGGETVGAQALYTAIQRGRVAVFDRLDTDAGFASIRVEDRGKLLMVAAQAQSPHMVARLLARGISAGATDPEYGSALIQALSSSHGYRAPDADRMAVVKLLLKHGAPLEARDFIHWTALIHCYDEEPAFVRLLLAHGAKVDAADKQGDTILYLTDDEEIALIAIKAGADVRRKRDGETLAQIAKRKRWPRVQRLLAGR